MLKPINISALDTTNELSFKCKKCENHGTIKLTNSIISIDREGNPIESLDGYNCQNCGQEL